MAFQKGSLSFPFGERGKDHLQVFHDLRCDDEGVEDHLPESRFLDIFQLDHRLDFRNLDEISNLDQSQSSSKQSNVFQSERVQPV